jgi:hypothetical protein
MLKVTDFISRATFQLSAREGDILPCRSIQTIGSKAGIAEHIETPMTSHGTPKGEPGGVSTMRKTPPYWRVVVPETLLEAPEGSADQPTPGNNNETNTTITSHVNPFFKKVLVEGKASLVNSFIWRSNFNEMFPPVKIFFWES